MVTVLVAIDTVYKQMVAILLGKKGNRDPFASRSLAAFARHVGHPKVIIQGDSEHALMAVIHDACVLLTAATPRTSLVNSKGSNGAAERAVQSVEGMARTLRLDLLGRTNIAVGSDLPITSWMVRHAARLLSHFKLDQPMERRRMHDSSKDPTNHLRYLSLNGSCGKIRRSSLRS